MTTPKRPTREQVENYWYKEGTPKPEGYDYWYSLESYDREICPKCDIVNSECECE